MSETFFVGRKHEFGMLDQLRSKRSASLVVLRGRRRIGKSRLISEFGRRFSQSLMFTGLPPHPGTTAQGQREEFAAQLARQLHIPKPRADDWGDLFWILADQVTQGDILLVLDEINWMGSEDPDFLGKVKTAWDLRLKSNHKLMFILSGSASTWIGNNILSSSGFLGRTSLEMILEELRIQDCVRFWEPHQISTFEILKVLAVTGGVPRYLEEILPTQTAEQNIERLCFRREGFLVHEFDRVFSDLFDKRVDTYRRMIEALVPGAAEAQEIYARARLMKGGVPYSYLDDLVTSGFVKREYTWSLATGEPSKLSKFRLSDNYLRFYLKYIAPIRHRLESGSSGHLPKSWQSIVALQFENLVLNNRNIVLRCLGINERDVIADSPFFQRPTKKQPGCQIDYLVQDRFGTLYPCEVKFKQTPLDYRVIDESKKKIAALKRPHNTSIRPILIYAGKVADSLRDSEYFASIVNFEKMLELP